MFVFHPRWFIHYLIPSRSVYWKVHTFNLNPIYLDVPVIVLNKKLLVRYQVREEKCAHLSMRLSWPIKLNMDVHLSAKRGSFPVLSLLVLLFWIHRLFLDTHRHPNTWFIHLSLVRNAHPYSAPFSFSIMLEMYSLLCKSVRQQKDIRIKATVSIFYFGVYLKEKRLKRGLLHQRSEIVRAHH